MGNSPSKKKNKGGHQTKDPPLNATPSSSNPPPNTVHHNTHVQASNPVAAPAKVEPQAVKQSPSLKSNSLKSDEKGSFNIKRLEELFDHYKETESQIGPGGIEALCGDVGVDPENVVVLVLAWHLNAQKMGYFKREEFINGLQSLGVDTVDKLKNQLNNVFRNELDDPAKYKEIYRYAFSFAKEEQQKILDLATADAMLELLMGGRFPHTENLREFMTVQTTYKSINLDQWMNILEFSRTIKGDLSNYDENGAWPVLLDEYVEWIKEGKK